MRCTGRRPISPNPLRPSRAHVGSLVAAGLCRSALLSTLCSVSYTECHRETIPCRLSTPKGDRGRVTHETPPSEVGPDALVNSPGGISSLARTSSSDRRRGRWFGGPVRNVGGQDRLLGGTRRGNRGPRHGPSRRRKRLVAAGHGPASAGRDVLCPGGRRPPVAARGDRAAALLDGRAPSTRRPRSPRPAPEHWPAGRAISRSWISACRTAVAST
jgi:hypothetical protein